MDKSINTKFKTNKQIFKILDSYKFHFKKKLGQNFLIKNNILHKIISVAEINCSDIVIEIGAGGGQLSQLLAFYSEKLIIFEKDTHLKQVLIEVLKQYKNIEYIWNDFLKINLKTFSNLKDIKIVSNLPYYISTKIIDKILKSCIEEDVNIRSLTVMLQKEVADKFVAVPNTKNYSSITVFNNSISNIKYNFTVNRTNFYPQPKVDSAVITISPMINKYFNNKDEILKFEMFIRSCFLYKRKTLYNNLKCIWDTKFIQKVYDKFKLPYLCRAEEISIKKFIEIFYVLYNKNESRVK